MKDLLSHTAQILSGLNISAWSIKSLLKKQTNLETFQCTQKWLWSCSSIQNSTQVLSACFFQPTHLTPGREALRWALMATSELPLKQMEVTLKQEKWILLTQQWLTSLYAGCCHINVPHPCVKVYINCPIYSSATLPALLSLKQGGVDAFNISEIHLYISMSLTIAHVFPRRRRCGLCSLIFRPQMRNLR